MDRAQQHICEVCKDERVNRCWPSLDLTSLHYITSVQPRILALHKDVSGLLHRTDQLQNQVNLCCAPEQQRLLHLAVSAIVALGRLGNYKPEGCCGGLMVQVALPPAPALVPRAVCSAIDDLSSWDAADADRTAEQAGHYSP